MWLERLIGEKLSSVTFVMDYWQLNFDGHGFNAMSKITVQCDACTINSVQPGFRDLLCGQIAKTVRTAGWTEGRVCSLRLRMVAASSCPLDLRITMGQRRSISIAGMIFGLNRSLSMLHEVRREN